MASMSGFSKLGEDVAVGAVKLPEDALAVGVFQCGCLVRVDREGIITRQECTMHQQAPALADAIETLRVALEEMNNNWHAEHNLIYSARELGLSAEDRHSCVAKLIEIRECVHQWTSELDGPHDEDDDPWQQCTNCRTLRPVDAAFWEDDDCRACQALLTVDKLLGEATA